MQWIASLTAHDGIDPRRDVEHPPKDADIVEIRLDLLPGLDPGTTVAACPLPVLLTLRSTAEGGRGPDDPRLRAEILRRACDSGAHWVDFEWARDLPLIDDWGLPPERIVLSWHDPEGTPSDLGKYAEALLSRPCGLAKVIPTVGSLADLERVLGLWTTFTDRRRYRRLIAFGMGAVGLPSRFLSPLMGAPLGFAAWPGRTAAAPGQQTAEGMRGVIGHLNGKPRRVFGVVGSDVSGSLSPLIYGAAFAAAGLPDLFLPVSVPDPRELDRVFTPCGSTLFDRFDLPVHGWAVTMPYKSIAADSATELAPRVRRARAANTLLLKPGRIIAENTDADGVVGSLKAMGIDPAGSTALIHGTGGAARGAAIGLHLAGADVTLRGRDSGTTARVAEEIGVGWCDPDDRGGAEILVNATPLGRSGDDPLPFTPEELETAGAVIDMVYREGTTDLVRTAEDSGLPVVDGRTMLAYQAMAQFGAFTGTPPPRRAILKAVGKDA